MKQMHINSLAFLRTSSTLNVLRSVLSVILMAAHPVALAAERNSADYPTKPIRWIVPFAPSGSLDATTRYIANELAQQNSDFRIVIDNRPGGAGTIGAVLVQSAPADGYTMLVKASDLYVKQALSTANGLKHPYDLNNFTPVIQFTLQPYILSVHSSVPVKTVPELIEYAKSKPGTLNIASAGTGGGQHLAGVVFSKRAGIQWTHVPFKGGGAAHVDLLAGHVQLMFVSLLTTREYAKQGRIRYLGATSLKRMAALPNLPTVAEVMPGFEFVSTYGLLAPPRTPVKFVNRMNAVLDSVLQSPRTKQSFAESGVESVGGSPESMKKHVAEQILKWEGAVRAAGLKPE